MNDIKEARTDARLSKSAACELLGISIETLADWESGNTTLSEDIKKLIIEKMDNYEREHLRRLVDQEHDAQNRFILTDSDRENFKPLIEKFLENIVEADVDEDLELTEYDYELNLYNSGINPPKLQHLIEELGYEERSQYNFRDNDERTLYYEKKESKSTSSICDWICIWTYGRTFELKLIVKKPYKLTTKR